MAINLNGTTGITTTGLTSNGIDDNATSTAMTLDTSGNLLVGTNNQNWQTEEGMRYFNGDSLVVTRSSATPFSVNRLTDDGDLAVFRKGGSTVGSIGVSGQLFAVGRGDTTLGFDDANDAIYARGTSGAYRPDAIDLGSSANRFKDLYLSGGVYLGGTGSANKLDDYESGTWTPSVEGLSTAGTASYSVRDGRYVKVGRVVHVSLTINATNFSGTGSFLVTGLPFAYESIAGTILFAVQWNSCPFADYPDDKQQVVGIGTNDTAIQFRASSNNYATAHTQLQCKGGLAGIGYLRISGTYVVDE